MKFAIRQLITSPGFTIVALITLALGIGANTSAFTALNRLLLQSLPFREPGRLVQIWASTAREPLMAQAPGDYFDERDQNTVFGGVAAYCTGGAWSLAEPGQPAVLCGASQMTANFFSIVGVQPQLGRLFTAEEQEHLEPVTLISNVFWRTHYNADPKILGRTARLGSKIYTIVGVMPPSLDDPVLFETNPAFFPLDPTDVNRNLRENSWYHVAARLKPGVTLEQAQAEMTVLARRLAAENPKTNTGRDLKVVPFPTNSMGDTGSRLTWLVMALSGMVLLIACVNLANLQLVRITRRGREIGIRLALGASRSQLIRMLVTESLILSVAGGALGVVVAYWMNSYIARFFELAMPLDLRVIAFTFAVAMITGITFGAMPAWIGSLVDVNASLKASGRGATSEHARHWLRQSLVVVQLGLALTLLTGAGFFVSGIYQLTHRELGWNTDNELVGFIALDHDNYGEQKDPRSVAFADRMREALRGLPGMEAVAISQESPAWGFGSVPFVVDGQPPPAPGKETFAGAGTVGPGFLDVFKIRLLEGREFRDTDGLGSPAVVIVNKSMAQKLWPGESAIGKRIGGSDPNNPQWAEVVGVMNDFKGAAEFYDPSVNNLKFLRPWAQNSHRFISFNLRTAGNPEAMKETVRKAMSLLAPDVALSMLSTVRETMTGEVAYFSFLRRLLLQISALGLLLAAVGIYGVVANLVSERTKEIGIRMALGAQSRGVLWLFLRNGLKLALSGAAVGVAASFVLLSILKKMLPMIPGDDAVVVVFVALLLILTALVACWLPARRTTRVSPLIALRAE